MWGLSISTGEWEHNRVFYSQNDHSRSLKRYSTSPFNGTGCVQKDTIRTAREWQSQKYVLNIKTLGICIYQHSVCVSKTAPHSAPWPSGPGTHPVENQEAAARPGLAGRGGCDPETGRHLLPVSDGDPAEARWHGDRHPGSQQQDNPGGPGPRGHAQHGAPGQGGGHVLLRHPGGHRHTRRGRYDLPGQDQPGDHLPAKNRPSSSSSSSSSSTTADDEVISDKWRNDLPWQRLGHQLTVLTDPLCICFIYFIDRFFGKLLLVFLWSIFYLSFQSVYTLQSMYTLQGKHLCSPK